MNDDLLALKEKIRGFEEFAIFKTKNENTVVKFVTGKVSTVQRLNDEVYYVLLKSNKKYIITTLRGNVEIDNFNNLIKIMDEPKLSPKISDNDREYRFIKLDDEIEKIREDPSNVISLVLSSEYPISGIINIRKVSISLLTSKGFNGNDTRNSIDGYFRAFNGDFSGQWAFASSKYSDSIIKDSVNTACEFASINKKIDIDDGKYDVVLSPLVFGNLMNYLAGMSSGLSIMMGESIFAKYKPGNKIANEKFTFSDVPKEDRPSALEFDQEATFTRNKKIIDHGVYNTPLLNNEIAEIMNLETTGNAGWISPTPWTLDVEQGTISKDSLLSGNVIMFNNNWYTRFQNYVEGNFSTVGRDAVVVYKNGNIEGVAGRLRIADSLNNIIGNIEELSKERYLVKWWDAPLPVLSPYVLIKDVKITKA
ncbi:TldD/PmbA family protein [Acidianus brierleyi]|uniref:TldD/PmbA family protein n=1 Tax=Acidianus brierleyi TaxID=41673 RepID=A0A2U9ICQ4_9CREN|nr:TldD/PmbA family protein [Acidianus brierleyi]AWR93798.1 TldD/PmbA family protein [Acidianus brierleyi]